MSQTKINILLKIAKLKLERDKLNHKIFMDKEKLRLLQDNTTDIQEDDGFIQAMQAEVKNIWKDEIIANEKN